MGSVWGRNLKISIFGESHGPAVGAVIDGFPPGIAIDHEKLRFEMGRRKPKVRAYSTGRSEPDEVEILSGVYNGITTGAPIAALIRNTDVRSKDYDQMKTLMRPGHADYAARVRYGGFNDVRGGGHFSARLTAPIVFAGALAQLYLDKYGITIGSHIHMIHDVYDACFDPVSITKEQLVRLRGMEIPVNDASCAQEFLNVIEKARAEGDSVGGIIETAAINLRAGLGSPIFENVESILSSFLFSIPAVKGVEFGAGFSISGMYGSEANDELYFDNGQVRTRTNNNGGINGGITNGMPLVFRVAVKPTASIAQEQATIDVEKNENATISIKGRHDACIVPRAVPVVDAACAICLCDLLLGCGGQDIHSK
jgi:chorismate synthase